MTPFTLSLPYPSRRAPVFARNVVATSQPLAAQAGLRMLQVGGNALDAALAAAIALTVVEPTSNGIGGDLFAIVWDGDRLHGLNASGRSPRALTPERFAGREQMPLRGWDAVTVPGAVSGWVDLAERFGKLPFEQIFEPAVRYARDGFPVGPHTAEAWSRAPETFREFPEFGRAFLPGGRAPRAGETFAFPEQARTLELIATTRGDAFYRGELADRIVDCARAGGALLDAEDLASHTNEWCGTISQPYHEVELHQIPPNGQGLVALIALGILAHHPVRDYPVDSADSLHVQIEAMKLAFADAYRYVADRDHMAEVGAADLLDPAYLASRAALIDMTRAQDPGYGVPRRGGTVYVTAADDSGMMVSLIQSNYHGFGSGVVIPGTGIALQNRGAGFVLEPGHPNRVGGGKRPFHTIIPGFLTAGGAPLLSFGVIGGHVQPQVQTQLVVRLRDHAQNPQAACDAPRWHLTPARGIALEPGVAPAVAEELARRGHRLDLADDPTGRKFYGGAQLIYRLEGCYLGASDHRREGMAVGV